MTGTTTTQPKKMTTYGHPEELFARFKALVNKCGADYILSEILPAWMDDADMAAFCEAMLDRLHIDETNRANGWK